MSEFFYRRGTGIGVKSFILFLKVYFDYFRYFFERCPDSLTFELKSREGTIRPLTLETNKRYHIETKETLNNIDFGFLRKGLPHGKIIPGGIGYMKVPTFDVDRKQFHKKIKEIINKFKENRVKGIIIDVRFNGGGNESFRDLLGFLTHQPIEINKFRYKLTKRFHDITGNRLKREYRKHKVHHNTAVETGYSKWLSWVIYPNEEQYLVSLPGVVLCNELSFSSTLSFVNACMNFNLATVIGNVVPLDGHGLSKQVFLPSKKYVILYPFHESRNPDFSHLENQSRSPDIAVSQGMEDYWLGIDTQLEKAIKFLQGKEKKD
jgi:C-terminal processing protease CtpA/Prc